VYSRQLERLIKEDIIAAYITGKGYVGIGRVMERPTRINKFLYKGKSLKGMPLVEESLFINEHNEKSEYAIRIDWIKTVDVSNAFWRAGIGLFAKPHIQCSLENQPKTIAFLENSFKVKFW